VLLAAEPGDDLNLDGNASRQLGHTDRCTGMAPGITEHLDQQIRAPIQDRSGGSKPGSSVADPLADVAQPPR
jgi:hypothetical protein